VGKDVSLKLRLRKTVLRSPNVARRRKWRGRLGANSVALSMGGNGKKGDRWGADVEGLRGAKRLCTGCIRGHRKKKNVFVTREKSGRLRTFNILNVLKAKERIRMKRNVENLN